ncbi:ankyrin repeat and zinc finger domain-containing protein 1 isoform X2 [Neltuma alba]|uniref:ankyrin repeat and zinc finger domain-containing protein 1 isoform X2 n=1 Tax=Neltuma alba TaxID=207710 RepID=UPI0010A4AD93|nr:ankyrin repeat and zinc finger domain-containing protein 1 isoform X2 [Prosopis alba]
MAKRHRSIFELQPEFFHSCRLLASPRLSASDNLQNCYNSVHETVDPIEKDADGFQDVVFSVPRWTCNTCKAQFDSLQDQRLHFKSDVHRFNVKLTMAGKSIVKEEDFGLLTSDSIKDYDVSSISGSEDDDDGDDDIETRRQNVRDKLSESFRQKLIICLPTGERVSIWKCLVMNMGDNILNENEVIERLKSLTLEPRNKSRLRIVLLASGGHFAGCVFDGDELVAHKTFHRYVVRAKAGKKQSTKDATGRAAHSAGASLRRHNELALRKEIQELLTGWRAYFDASNCIFVHDPSSSRQLLFDGERPYFSNQHNVTRSIPLTVRRPTLREAKRVYSQLTQVSYEVEEDLGSTPITVRNANPAVDKEAFTNSDSQDKSEACSSKQDDSELLISSASESENGIMGKSTPLHQAVQSGDSHKVLKLLEQGIDPCIKDERGRTPYMLAHDKEVRNTFRRFMASNPEKWDWRAAKVPSALTKEMEESQAAKQAEKDAKRKARAKELKKLRKAKEKRAQAEAAKNASKTAENEVNAVTSTQKLSKEEELRRAQAEEREKRAGAAERRLAALKIQGSSATTVLSTSEPKGKHEC